MKQHTPGKRSRAPVAAADRMWRTAWAPSTSMVLVLACAAQFMVVLDVSVVNVALPSIQSALGFDPVSLQWVVNGYGLVFAGFLLLGGRLADLYGRKRIFLVGLGLFSAASLVGGLAAGPAMLIAARAAQGLGAAILAPATLTILTTTFPEGPQRTRALAIWPAAGIGGGAAGNLVGGLLTQYLSWRWILLINVPLGILAIALAVLFLSDGDQRGASHRLDIPGAVLATMGLASFTFGITQIQSRGWNDPVALPALAAGTVALAAFVAVEIHFAGAPLLPLRLFRSRAISTGNVVMLLAGACFIPMWYFLSLFMQNVLGYGALKTGVAFVPHTLITMAASLLAPRVMRYVDARALIAISAGVAAAGFLWQSRITPDSGYLSGVLGPAVIICAGLGLLITPITATVTSGTDESDAGAASGLMNATRQVGGALGLAVLIAIAGSNPQSTAGLAHSYGRAFLAIAAILIVVAAAALALPVGRDASETPPAEPVKTDRRQLEAVSQSLRDERRRWSP